MSNNDSFVEEVSEAVRRDRLFATFRKYGWIAGLVVIAIVGGAAWSEYTKARDAAEAEALGDALLVANEADDAEERAAALTQVEADGGARAVAGMLSAGALEEAGDAAAAAQLLRDLSSAADVPPLYRDLAALKAVMVDPDMPPEEKVNALDSLAQPGAPFQLLAKEQQAYAQVAAGDRETALGTLRSIVDDAGVSQGLRDRAQTLIVALGGDVTDGGAAPEE
ncbi:hypothetical protein [Pelagovum pacificum]|uniref:Tetratricopeptide repeat protein n=1 Tax=Pelagovum pacificum TaxID=2588711 RepID=A0A5C5GEH9_9RHOB|nr:hypothetical protein [Pelagovum pacificum]QQA44435.1 hypothetical protein I8N54_07660 [Pelagovum pacificum]TNY32447.1 hypothetical protein FHY64_03915 [Pelagovum pacificum]